MEMISLLEYICVVPYTIMAVVAWRMMAGSVAWSIHTSSRHRRGISPEIEDWVLAGILTVLLAPLWPIVGLFRYAPRRFKTESERECERLATEIKVQRLANEHKIKQLEQENDLN